MQEEWSRSQCGSKAYIFFWSGCVKSCSDWPKLAPRCQCLAATPKQKYTPYGTCNSDSSYPERLPSATTTEDIGTAFIFPPLGLCHSCGKLVQALIGLSACAIMTSRVFKQDDLARGWTHRIAKTRKSWLNHALIHNKDTILTYPAMQEHCCSFIWLSWTLMEKTWGGWVLHCERWAFASIWITFSLAGGYYGDTICCEYIFRMHIINSFALFTPIFVNHNYSRSWKWFPFGCLSLTWEVYSSIAPVNAGKRQGLSVTTIPLPQ